MKTLRHLRIIAVAVLLLLFACRNEDFTGQYVNSKREEAFFREALSKTSRLRNNKIIIESLKKHNERSHFVSKMKDQSGLPMWDKMLAFKKPKTANRGEDGGTAEEYVIPLTENEKNLSSVLFVTKYADNSFDFNNIDNEQLKQEIFNTNLDRDYRENLLLNFILADNISFTKDAVYWNIPDDLLPSIPKSTIYPQRRFKVSSIDTSENGGNTSNLNTIVICVEYELECPVCDDGAGHNTHVSDCLVVYPGGGGGGGGGNTGGGTPPGGDGGGGGGLPTGDPGSNTDCNSPNKAFYKIVPGCDDDDSLPTQVKTLKNKLLSINSNNDISEYTYFLSSYPSTAQVFANFLNQNYNQMGADIVMSSIKFWFTYPDTLNPDQLPARINNLNNLLTQNPDALLDIPCGEVPKWKDVANYQIPQSVKDRVNQVNSHTGWFDSASLQSIYTGGGPSLNMDLFPVKINTLPNKPGTNIKFTPTEFFEYFRKNINSFVYGSSFIPYVNPDYGINDAILWNSSNPLGAFVHITIPLNSGTVITSGYNSQAWIFTTVDVPWDDQHPVSGNRLFGYYMEGNTMYIYSRGVDRFTFNFLNYSATWFAEGIGFNKADDLWSSFQTKISQFVNNGGGQSSIIPSVKYRPNWITIRDYMKGKVTLNSLGCH